MKKQIPNIITLCNLFCGMMATYHAFYSRFEYAAIFILLGILFDFFDGLAARLLHVASPIGKELDSLADVITSGVAPGAILFNILWNHSSSIMIKYVAFLIPVFAAYRLAKFNLDERQHTSFRGLPAPAMAVIWAGIGIWCSNIDILPYPAWISESLIGSTEYLNTDTGLVVLALISIVTDILLISDIKMFSLKFNFKELGWKQNATRYIFILVSAILIVLLGSLVLPLLILWYIIWSVCTQRKEPANEYPKAIEIADFDYPLPNERIAKFPLEQRDQSKLLVCRNGQITQSQFYHIPEILPKDTLLVMNNTKVIHARLFFRKPTGSMIEVFCLEPWQMPVAQSFEETEHCTWMCFIGNNKKWKDASLSREVTINNQPATLTATRKEAVGNAWIVEFHWSGGFSFAEIIDQAGVIPLPPYLHREAEASDNDRYQTVYAEHQGSVAAPTAGLHFTPEVFEALNKNGIQTEFITLHVGAGTFKPVSTATIGEHEMHVEKVEISIDNIEHILQHMGRTLISVGTTTVRTLESLYWFGVKLSQNPQLEAMHVLQWDPYELESLNISAQESYENVLSWMKRNELFLLEGDTQLMIAPGYRYHIVNGIITNFHQPKSTLLLLVSALIGDIWKECYQYALDHDFRFLSYGDSCLFIP